MHEIKEILSSPQNIIVTTHVNPDGDAIGSSLALKIFLDKLGHNTNVIVPNDYPEFLKWMKNNDSIINFSSSKSLSQNLIEESDVIFCLDFNNLDRINDLGKLISNSLYIFIFHI